MCDDAHAVQQLPAEKLEAGDAALGIVREILLKHEQIVGQPHARIARKDRFDVRQRLDNVNARAAAPLLK